MSTPCGAFVFSLDFELAWGYQHLPHAPDLRPLYRIVPQILDIFKTYDVSATWAAVGHLMLSHEQAQSEYPRIDGVPYHGEEGTEVFYAPALVQSILDCPTHQELACHSFTHAPIGSSRCPADVARQELQRCQVAGEKWGRRMESVVFPWNVVGRVDLLEECGYKCYRAENSEWYWFRQVRRFASCAPRTLPWRVAQYAIRSLRLIDELACLAPPLPRPRRLGDVWEIPHSMFFPGFSGVSSLVPADWRRRRAVVGLRRAAARKRIFGMFTHPHNLLSGTEPLLRALEGICRQAAALRDAGRLKILTMAQAREALERGEFIE